MHRITNGHDRIARASSLSSTLRISPRVPNPTFSDTRWGQITTPQLFPGRRSSAHARSSMNVFISDLPTRPAFIRSSHTITGSPSLEVMNCAAKKAENRHEVLGYQKMGCLICLRLATPLTKGYMWNMTCVPNQQRTDGCFRIHLLFQQCKSWS